jgi:hypothetical protein
MRTLPPIGSLESVRRKLRAVAAVLADKAATEHERVNAAAVKARLERRLRAAGEPRGDWTDSVFRLGRLARKIEKSAVPRSPRGDWTDHARRLGKALRRGYTRWLSD